MKPKKRKRTPLPDVLACFHDTWSQRWPCQALVGDAYIYLFVPRDKRYANWHKAYWWSVPEWARVKLDDGVHRIDANYERQAVTLLQAFYPEARVVISNS